jgi:hypothetical protein
MQLISFREYIDHKRAHLSLLKNRAETMSGLQVLNKCIHQARGLDWLCGLSSRFLWG